MWSTFKPEKLLKRTECSEKWESKETQEVYYVKLNGKSWNPTSMGTPRFYERSELSAKSVRNKTIYSW